MLQSSLISPATGSLAAIVGTPPAAQRSAGDGGATPDSFAMALNQASSPPPPPAPSPATPARQEPPAEAAPPDATTAEDRPDASADNANVARATGQRKAAPANAVAADEKSAAAALAAAPAWAQAAPGALATTGEETPKADRARDPGDPAPDTGSLVAALLAGTPAAIDRSAGKAGSTAAGAAAVGGGPVAARNGAAPVTDAAAAGAAGAARRADTAADATAVASERDTAPRAAPAVAVSASAAATAITAAAAPLHAPSWVAPTAAGSAGTTTVVEGRLQPSPGGADFAPALGAQLNVFLREGVQHARLHLNPAELGPLTVQIQLDGAAAQVRLAAEHPLTRQALEQAMPTLAGALRESGLTLTGGGVFEQPANPQPQQDARANPGERRTLPREGQDGAVQADVALPRATVARRGVVDLVA